MDRHGAWRCQFRDGGKSSTRNNWYRHHLIGLADLSQNLGHPGAYDHPEVVAASHHIVDVARAAGKHIGVPAANAATMKPWMDRGVRLFFCAVDVPLLAQALKTALKNCEPSS